MSNKLGVYVCECGPNISSKIDIEKVKTEISGLNDFKDTELIVKNHKLLCSVAGKKFLEKEINENGLTHLICAACSPRDHDSTFMGVCKKTDLNPYLYRMVNIREQCAWIFPDKDVATQKAIRYIRAGMDRVLYQNPLMEKELESCPDVLIIGGGVAGMEAALNLASDQRKVHIVEKRAKIGGISFHLSKLLNRQGDNLNILKQKAQNIIEDKNIRVYTETEVTKIVGFLGNFEIELKNNKTSKIDNLLAGAIIIANGFELLNPSILEKYKYTDKDNVYTALEIETRYSQTGKIKTHEGKIPENVALIHCVGREQAGYCSNVCCNYLLKIAGYFKEQQPETKITELYKHFCFPNKEDQSSRDSLRDKGVIFEKVTDIKVNGTQVDYVSIAGTKEQIKPDMIILGNAVIPSKDNKNIAEMLKLDLDNKGFFQEAHAKINPISTNSNGIFIIGATRSPCGISAAMIQAQAASGKIKTFLVPGQKIVPEVIVSEILEAYCTGCKTCLDVCAFGAIYFDEIRGISVVNEAICRGCGNCVGSCPSGSIRAKNFTNLQLYQEVKEALR